VIQYRIEKSPYEAGRWILHNGSAIFGGTWREFAEKLRELHPNAKLFRHPTYRQRKSHHFHFQQISFVSVEHV
jgi:hypothetical protein